LKVNKQEQIKPGAMFLIVPRKVGYIYINATWSVYNFGRLDDIKNVYISNRSIILKIIIGILAIWIVMSIITIGKKGKKTKKVQKNKK
jgi:hypothetical protein